jgi:hypothetical protein
MISPFYTATKCLLKSIPRPNDVEIQRRLGLRLRIRGGNCTDRTKIEKEII